MGTKHETTPCSADDLTQIAKKLEYFAKRYRDLVAQMTGSGITSADVTGVKTLSRAIEYLQGSVASATAAVDNAIITGGKHGTQTEEEIQEALEEAEDATRRHATKVNNERHQGKNSGRKTSR